MLVVDGCKVEYYASTRLLYQSLTYTDKAVVAYVSPHLCAISSDGRARDLFE